MERKGACDKLSWVSSGFCQRCDALVQNAVDTARVIHFAENREDIFAAYYCTCAGIRNIPKLLSPVELGSHSVLLLVLV
jgi:hypothetical protein